MRILVIDDEQKLAVSIKKGLEQEHYVVDIATDGEDGFDFASTGTYDAIILDRMLPHIDGIEICQRLRQMGVHTPILLLTARTQLEDKVLGLDSGADDYLTKPFAFSELVARLRALARRPNKQEDVSAACGSLRVNNSKHEVMRGTTPISLTPKEFFLLEYLLQHKGKTCSKATIIEQVWPYESDILPNTVEVYVGYLRKKIDSSFPNEPALIHTIRGFGYRLGE